MKVMAYLQLNVELDIDARTEEEAKELFFILTPEELQSAVSATQYFDVYDSEILGMEEGA
jgi:hypothetical protein